MDNLIWTVWYGHSKNILLKFTFDHWFFYVQLLSDCKMQFYKCNSLIPDFTAFQSFQNLEIFFLSQYLLEGFLTNPFFYCLLLAPNYCVKMYQREFWRMMLTVTLSPLCTLFFYAYFYKKRTKSPFLFKWFT